MARPVYGTILIEALIVIAIVSIVTALSAQTIYVSVVGTEFSSNKNSATALIVEMFETVENIASERWQNIFNLNKDGSLYHPSSAGGTWAVSAGSEEIAVGGESYSRSFIVQNVCRDTGTKAITGTTDTNGSAATCAVSGGVFDPSTEKITATVTVPKSDAQTESAYITRWRNKVCEQTSWTSGGSSAVKTCPDATYDTSTNITGGDSLELCSGGC